MRHIKKIISWYSRFEKPISSISLIVGFFVGSLTLTRVDKIFENVLIGIQLVAVAICIVILHRQQAKHEISEKSDEGLARLHFWATTILQFLFGGILSTYLIFYFRGAVFGVAWPFLLILCVAIFLSEARRRDYTRIGFQIGFFFLSVFVFSLFFVPVILRQIGPGVFVLSLFASLFVLFLFLVALWFVDKERFTKGRKIFVGIIFGISLCMSAMYFLNIIPPLPILLRDSGLYHSLSRDGSGNYEVTQEADDSHNTVLRILDGRPTVHIVPGSPVYAYSAIFSPVLFNTKIVHEWQTYNKASHAWVTKETINLAVVGGRKNGYRTYSASTDLSNGKWRVNVKTQNGQVIGRMSFNVEWQNNTPLLHTIVK